MAEVGPITVKVKPEMDIIREQTLIVSSDFHTMFEEREDRREQMRAQDGDRGTRIHAISIAYSIVRDTRLFDRQRDQETPQEYEDRVFGDVTSLAERIEAWINRDSDEKGEG